MTENEHFDKVKQLAAKKRLPILDEAEFLTFQLDKSDGLEIDEDDIVAYIPITFDANKAFGLDVGQDTSNDNIYLTAEWIMGDALINEVSAIAYDKAVDVVADTARKEVLDISVEQMDKHASWLDSPERKADAKTRHYAIQQLGAVKKHIMAAVAKLSVHLMEILQKPDVKRAAMQEIQKQAKPSVMEMLRKKKKEAAQQENVQKNEKKRQQNMER